MKRFSEQFHKQASKVHLSAAEKHDLQTRITTFMEYHPLATRTSTASRAQSAIERSPFFILTIPTRYFQSFGMAAAVLVLVVMPFVAEQTVPGDVLYPVKVRINEEVMGSFNRTAYDKVEWETKRLERRLSEARLLAEAGKLTPEVEADVVAAVKQHTIDAANTIAELRTEDSQQATLAEITLATRLGLQETLLQTALAADTAAEGVSVEGIAAAVSVGQDEALGREGDVSFEHLLAELERETTRLYELLNSLKKNTDTQAAVDVERRIHDIERQIYDATLVSSEQPEKATAALRAVWQDAQKLISYSTDLDVRSSLSLDQLVPVVLTSEERLAALEDGLISARMTLLEIQFGNFVTPEPEILEKIQETIVGVAEGLDIAETLQANDITAAEIVLQEQQAILDSITSLVTITSGVHATTSVPVVPVEEGIDTATTTTATSTESSESTF